MEGGARNGVLEKNGQNNRLARLVLPHPVWEILDPPLFALGAPTLNGRVRV